MKILVVDDDQAVLRITCRILQAAGHDTAGAENGLFGYFNFLVTRPDLVITDIEMPLQSGLTMMKQIRKVAPRIPAIYMSASIAAYRRRLEAERRRHVTVMLEKPFSAPELLQAMSELVGARSRADLASRRFGPAHRLFT
ncbi:MAG TPA: response regulator [Candidatus Eisenbacteria bacterium]|nr:response regulator [Candidatus Eisenbacteria bacterium]